MKRNKIIGLIILTFMVVVGCGEGTSVPETENDKTALSGNIRIDGSSTVYPITEAIAEEYRTEAPNVKVTVGVSGTGGGFKKFTRGETDINDASRTIKDKEVASCNEANIKYVELTIAYDGLAVIINPQNDWVDHFTTAELKKLWEESAQGTLTKWNQIRPEWPNEEIQLFGPGVESGTYDYFVEAIIGDGGSSRGDYTASEDDNILVQGVSTNKYGLGFFGLAYFEENKDKLKLVGIDDGNSDNGNGAILPTLETVKNGSYAPLSRPVFIYVADQAAKRNEVQSFVEFYLNNAGSIAQEVGYIPLPDETYNVEKEEFKNFVASLDKPL